MFVRKVKGEALVFEVESASREDFWHRVELDAYGGNGKCGCENFAFNMEAYLSRGALPSERYECNHIHAAKRFFTFEMLWKVMAWDNTRIAALHEKMEKERDAEPDPEKILRKTPKHEGP
jgi:hypothetical protein